MIWIGVETIPMYRAKKRSCVVHGLLTTKRLFSFPAVFLRYSLRARYWNEKNKYLDDFIMVNLAMITVVFRLNKYRYTCNFFVFIISLTRSSGGFVWYRGSGINTGSQVMVAVSRKYLLPITESIYIIIYSI